MFSITYAWIFDSLQGAIELAAWFSQVFAAKVDHEITLKSVLMPSPFVPEDELATEISLKIGGPLDKVLAIKQALDQMALTGDRSCVIECLAGLSYSEPDDTSPINPFE